ncbi:polysaccharide pyruvyl transferase family protein [Paracoccus hibiscisoli]|uniref:polysaccharide pyruvyl transferase family protein n=1 Tax=Paracoccus hibiscisoli TaxID=2023261 RepID=UPI0023EF9315|nr:polysaccharide pyruvyl transferase family protein [Paracoccus hibiscisoli]
MTANSSIPTAVRTEQSHLDVIERLQGLIDAALAPSLPILKAQPYALLDMPDYSNVGDSAIWAGALAWLRRNAGKDPSYVAENNASIEEVNAYFKGGAILLQGGGNFGDIWPQFQEFRERIISTYPMKHVVQMPQSIHFSDDRALAKTAAVLRDATHLRLLVRDFESYDLASTHFGCEVTLCPDMAFALGPLKRSKAPDLDVLLLLRTDKESMRETTMIRDLPAGWEQTDWIDEDPDTRKKARFDMRVSAVLSLNMQRLSKLSRRKHYYQRVTDTRMKRGTELLSRAKFIITDRLHVHIISTLMGIPHCFLDNNYGKIFRFSTAFDTRWTGSHHASSLPDAIACARQWLTEKGPVS